jgi:hypothetical protein
MLETESKSEGPSKLDIDRPQEFKFHLAYGVYSRAWDGNTSESARARLNELISALSKDDTEDGYHTFYSGIQEYRNDATSFRHGRTRIETQRKRDWQRRSARDNRNRRHK